MSKDLKTKLGDFVDIRTGKLDANAADENGRYPFFTCSVTPLQINTPAFDCEAVLVAGNGDLNVKHYKGKFNAYQRTYVIKAKIDNDLHVRYLFHFLENHLIKLREESIGGVIKYIKIGNLTDIDFLPPSIEEQKRITTILDTADTIRTKRKEAIIKLDQLAQSVFLEMFGDPVKNNKGWEKLPIVNCCTTPDDIRCGPFGTQLQVSDFLEHGVPLWGIKHVNKNFTIKTEEFVSEQKARELSNYILLSGDLVMTRKGTIGNCAIYPYHFANGIMHSDLLRLRLNNRIADSVFMKHQFQISKDIEYQISLISQGAIMAGINVGKLKSIKVLLPPLKQQMAFASRMEKIDGLKLTQISALRKEEQLFASLQQQAFSGNL